MKDDRSSSRGDGPPKETWLSGGPGSFSMDRSILNVALCYPSEYRFGMSNLGFHAALREFMLAEAVACERAFWDPHGETGRSFDTGSPLGRFDVLAFSASFEEDFFRIVEMLLGAGVPLEAASRGDDDPLVVMGGMCAALNPEPVAPFLDAVLVGGAEALVRPFVESVSSSMGMGRAERLARLARVPGVYVPSLYAVSEEDGRVAGFSARGAAPLPVRPAPGGATMAESVVLSDGAYFRDMHLIEISRGCARACRFCATGHVQRPVRFFDAESVRSSVERARGETARIGLVSSALGDHPAVEEMLGSLSGRGIELNVSSVRAESLDTGLAAKLMELGVRTVTIAPEAATPALRDVIGKSVSDEALLGAVRTLREADARGLKLYFMIGLPSETEGDVAEIPILARRMAAEFARGRGGTDVSVSVSTFVPKPRTPFQWLPMARESEIRAKLAMLRKAFTAKPRVEFSGVGPREAWRQGVIARGGRSLSEAIRLAVADGLPWKAALRRSGIDAAAVAGRRYADDEVFPWEIVEIGVSRPALLESLSRALRAAEARGAD